MSREFQPESTPVPPTQPADAPEIDSRELFRRCWFLTGATASGKTGAALTLAARLGAEIISLDSMAVYRGMDLGTAKPSPSEREAIPHHLIDLVDPTADFSVSEYLEAARRKVLELQNRGLLALFVGGTPLYLKSMLRGLYQGPPADWQFRRSVEAEVAECGLEALHQRLQQVDPLSAARLHPRDKRRIIRALEVYKITGRPLSHQQVHFDEGLSAAECRVFVLGRERAELHERINERVERMFANGLVPEVEALVGRYGELGRTARQAVGYREVLEYLEGVRDLPATIETVKSRTRQFARRQETWFRSLSECRRMEVAGEIGEPTIEEIMATGRSVPERIRRGGAR